MSEPVTVPAPSGVPSFTDLYDLASPRFGGAVLHANDEFFAPKENLLKPQKPVFLEHEYTGHGKWMDGWETRRKRHPGHDFCLVRLGLPGVVRGVVVDTSFFRGNYPEHASIEACALRPDAPVAELLLPGTRWTPLLPRSPLAGDAQNTFAIDAPFRVTHLRLNIFPDGGVARLRVHGEVAPDLARLLGAGREADLAAMEHGGLVLACSDMFFGIRHNLLLPGPSTHMGDGWETRRRRGPGHDWAVVRLGLEGTLGRLEVDTSHFKGNYPDTCSVEGCVASGSGAEVLSASTRWVEVLPRTPLSAHTRHAFDAELARRGPFTHLRLNVHPDGGVARLRAHGTPTREGAVLARLRRLDGLLREDAEAEMLSCCGSTAWAAAMVARRPFAGLGAALEAADDVAFSLTPDDWLEAFLAHPPIGGQKAPGERGHGERTWAQAEQSGVDAATAEERAGLREGNAAYVEKFGFVFLICATGKSAAEMLATLRARLASSRDEELAAAAEEQRKITRLRLAKLLDPAPPGVLLDARTT